MNALPAGPTKYVVLTLLLLTFGGVMWTLLDPVWFAFCAALLLLESWTLVNRYAGDTISEVVWYLNARPVVPFAFGLAVDFWNKLVDEGHLYLATAGQLDDQAVLSSTQNHVDDPPQDLASRVNDL